MNEPARVDGLALHRPSVAGMSPPRRWGSRVALPLLLLIGFAAIAVWAFRESLLPARTVRVEAVSLTGDSGPAEASGAVLFQAAGWIEPEPFAMTVSALTAGVVESVLVREGQAVAAGEILAAMVDADARLALDRAAAETTARSAAVEVAKGDRAAQEAEIARLTAQQSVREDEERTETYLKEKGASGPYQVTLARSRLEEARQAVAAAKARLTALDAGVRLADAALISARTGEAEARLRLERMKITAPAAGCVMRRLVAPGSVLDPGSPGGAGVIELYDPASIRVRVDVPLDRVPLVGRAGSIEIRSDTAPNRSFPGKVLRVVQVADVQKNTVQFHVGLDGAHPELRPETLCQARFVGGAGGAGAAAGGSSAVRVMVATRLVRDPDGSPWVWAVDPLTRCAQRRSLRLGGESGDRTIVEEGLRPGDRVLSDPPADLREGERLKITE